MVSPIAETLKKILAEKRLKVRDLLSKATIPRSTIYRHLRGETEPDLDQRALYAKAFGMTPEQFERRWQEEQDKARQPAGLREGDDGDDDERGLEPGVRLHQARVSDPVTAVQYHSVGASRPDGRDAVELGAADVPAGPGQIMVVHVDGQSMEPKYPDGKRVAFLRDATGDQQVIDGKDYLVWLQGGTCTFKQVFVDPEDYEYLVLRPRNADRARFPEKRVHRRRVVAKARALWVDADD